MVSAVSGIQSCPAVLANSHVDQLDLASTQQLSPQLLFLKRLAKKRSIRASLVLPLSLII